MTVDVAVISERRVARSIGDPPSPTFPTGRKKRAISTQT
jgi:hypothetical protein